MSLFEYCCGFCVILGAPGFPKGPLGGTLKSQLGVKIELWFPEGPQEGFRVPKVTVWEVIWECFGTDFCCIFDEVYVQVLVTVMSMSQHVFLSFELVYVV